EELEHIEDKWLDKAFERILLKEGDDLKWIKDAEKIVKRLNLNDSQTVNVKSEIPLQSNGSATAFAPAKDNKALEIVANFAKVEEIDETIPELPDNPTEADLWKYAENHPKVKKVLRIFRGKLINVKKE
ncbi:MAG: hypothetical protein ACR2MD_02975, partial [Aridibacter sp.]